MKIIFIGINGYQSPYTRVRCYHFADTLRKYGLKTEVFSYQEHLRPDYDVVRMLEIKDKEKLSLNLQALGRLFREKDAVFYIQKVHYHSAIPFLLARMGKNRVILDYDDWDLDRSPLFEAGYLNRLFFGCDETGKVTGKVAAKAAGCVASSRHLYDFLLAFNRNVCYIPTGVDTERFAGRRTKAGGKITFVWTGQVWGKVIYNNIIYLIDCFSEACREHADIRLKIIGAGALMPDVRSHINNNCPRLDIEVVDWVNPDDMPGFLSGADIGLLPLIPDPENELWMKAKSPTKLFEYMAMELPVIASRLGECEFIIKNGEDGFLAEDREDFIEKMKLLISDGALRARMGRLAREKAEKEYSLRVLGKRLFDFLSVCL